MITRDGTPSEWQDSPNALGLVGAMLGSHEGMDLRFRKCVIARPGPVVCFLLSHFCERYRNADAAKNALI